MTPDVLPDKNNTNNPQCTNNSELSGILVVDDDLPTLVMITEVLRQDYEVYVAKSGEKAFSILASGTRPELVLLDVNMPGLNGYDILTRLKQDQRTSEIPVIFVTGRDSDEDYTRGFDLGAVDYVVKPVNPAILKARIRTHISLARKTQALVTLATTDPLTKIANRRKYNEVTGREWARSMRQEHPLSLIVMDIDHFKAYNDNYGHGKGDDVLVRFGQILDKHCQRPSDLAARIGGEEFIALLPDTMTEGACEVMKAIQQDLTEAAIPHEHSGTAPYITCSAGIVTMIPVNGRVPDEMYKLADKALYEAKEKGRNTFVAVTSVENIISI